MLVSSLAHTREPGPSLTLLSNLGNTSLGLCFSTITKWESEAFLGLSLSASNRNLHQTGLSSKEHLLTHIIGKPRWLWHSWIQVFKLPLWLHSKFSSLFLFLPIFCPFPSAYYLCLLCSPFSHTVATRSSKLMWTFELMSPEIETKMHSLPASTDQSFGDSFIDLTWAICPSFEPMTLGLWRTSVSQTGYVPTPLAGSGG